VSLWHRIAFELFLPRTTTPWFVWIGRAVAVLVILWGIAVCVTITIAFLSAIFGF